MADDNLEHIRAELAELRQYERSYHPNEPAFRDTFMRLAGMIERLTDEVERLRGDDDVVMGGGIEPPFDPNDRPWQQ